MYRSFTIGLVIPAFNEAKLIKKTIQSVPDYVDQIVVVNDASTDTTAQELKHIAKTEPRLTVIANPTNQGVGFSVVTGLKALLSHKIAVIGVIAGDAQCNTNYLQTMIDTLIDGNYDYVKANRFLNHTELKSMPPLRRIGNILITMMTKFATGYYSIFDTQNGYGIFRHETLKQLDFSTIGQRYDYENTLLLALSFQNARIKDVAVPAIYGDEVSTIKFWPVATRALTVVWRGFWKRIYHRYVLNNFHPIALFLFSGLCLGSIGFVFGIIIAYIRLVDGLSPSTGTVMLAVLPFLTGFHLVVTAITLDMSQEPK